MDELEQPGNESAAETGEWEEFRDDDGDPIRVDDLRRLDLENIPEDIRISVFDDYFPETEIWREGELFVCEIQEHLYTKYLEHKFSAYALAEAMERAVRRLAHEGHPFTDPSRNDEDVHILVRWHLKLPRNTEPGVVAQSIRSAFDLVWHRADTILENSDSVLILGKDSGPALDRLKRMASKLEDLGYYTYIIKEQPDRPVSVDETSRCPEIRNLRFRAPTVANAMRRHDKRVSPCRNSSSHSSPRSVSSSAVEATPLSKSSPSDSRSPCSNANGRGRP